MSAHSLILAQLARPAAVAIRPKRAEVGRTDRFAFRPSGPGQALDANTRREMEPRFRHDLSSVRVHVDESAATSARAMGAAAFASGTDIGFARGRYDPRGGEGRNLLAHELAHVVQQAGMTGPARASASHEAEADAAADAVASGRDMPPLSASGPTVQCRVEMRRLGRGQYSGYDQLPRLIDRLNAISTATIFHVDAAGVLGFIENPYGDVTEFDRQMRALIGDARVIPLRLTNRHGLMFEDPDTYPATIPVEVDDWRSGYVDMDDLLASDDLGLQSALLHVLTERVETHRYAHRMAAEERDATGALIQTFPDAEYQRVHARGVDAEVRLMRDFFGDNDIAFRAGSPGNVLRQFTTGRPAGARRRDIIRVHMSSGAGAGARRGVNALTVDVLLADGTTMGAEDYRALLRRERAAAANPVQNRGNPVVGPNP